MRYHTLYQQYIPVGETADQARAAVSQTEAEAERRQSAYAQQQSRIWNLKLKEFTRTGWLNAKLKSNKLPFAKGKSFC